MPTAITSPAAASVAYNQQFNAFQDITWSLQYSLCGSVDSQGGFCAFLYDAPVLSGGGIGKSLGVAPSTDYTSFSNISGVSGAFLCIALDSHGFFAVSGNGLDTGIDSSAALPNSITIRTGTQFDFLTTFAISTYDDSFDVVKMDDSLERFRFRLTNASNVVEISHWSGENYDVWCSIPVSLNFSTSAMCRAGFSFASPLCGDANAAKFGIANAHFEGATALPTQNIVAPELLCKLPVVINLNQPAPSPVAIAPLTATLGDAYECIIPLPPDPCD